MHISRQTGFWSFVESDMQVGQPYCWSFTS